MEHGQIGSFTFIGTATALIRLGQFTVLTDPNFLHRGQHAYLGYGLTSRRLTEPSMTVDELPDLDAIVLSHFHGDHWDRIATRQLDRAVPVITTRDAAKRLRHRGFAAATGLRTWQTHTLALGDETLTISSLPGRHAPGPAQKLLPPVMGSMLEYALDGTVQSRLYITGDTLLIPELAEIPQRFSEIDYAMLHLGGTRLPGGLMVTMDGRQGTELVKLLPESTLSIPVHYDDYDVFKSPLSDFVAATEAAGVEARVRYVERGQTVTL